MKSQHILLTFFLFVALSFTRLSAQTVYVTETGKKYHAKNCSIAKTGKKGISLLEAKKAGYEPCKACKADEIVEPEEKKKAGGKK